MNPEMQIQIVLNLAAKAQRRLIDRIRAGDIADWFGEVELRTLLIDYLRKEGE